MPSRDPLSVNYDGVVHTLVLRAIYAQRNRRGVQAFVSSPRAEFGQLDRGGRTRHERAFTRSCYYLVWTVEMQKKRAGEGTGPVWALKLTWGDDLEPSARGRLARPVVLRVWPRDQARVSGPRWVDGSGFRSEVGARIDDLSGPPLSRQVNGGPVRGTPRLSRPLECAVSHASGWPGPAREGLVDRPGPGFMVSAGHDKGRAVAPKEQSWTARPSHVYDVGAPS